MDLILIGELIKYKILLHIILLRLSHNVGFLLIWYWFNANHHRLYCVYHQAKKNGKNAVFLNKKLY